MNTWAIVPGAIRDVPHLVNLLNSLLILRAKGLLEGIVLSTWDGEIERIPGLSAQLERANIVRVQVPEPVIKLQGHILHQMKALFYALEACPSECHILKLRTDKVELPEYIEEILKGFYCKSPYSDGFPDLLYERLIVSSYSVNNPFFCGDMWFFGHHEDVKKIIHFDLRYELMFPGAFPEQWYFSHPFIDKFPIFQDYFQKFPKFSIQKISKDIINQCMESDFYIDAMATYLQIVKKYFHVMPLSGAPGVQPDWPNLSYADILAGRLPLSPTNPSGQWLWRVHPSLGFVETVDITWSARLLNGELLRDQWHERFMEAVKRVSCSDYHTQYRPSFLGNRSELTYSIAAML